MVIYFANYDSFDRAFWLRQDIYCLLICRHFKFTNNAKYLPLKVKTEGEDGETDYEMACPFGNPEVFSIY